MSLIVPWVLFPLVLAAIGMGWGVLVERLADTEVDRALLMPLGLAAALVVAGTLNAFEAIAPAAVPTVAVGAVVGLALAWAGGRLPAPWAALAALAAFLAYGAPVLLSGSAGFTGFIRLDDTATWFNIMDHLFGHSGGGEPPSSYSLAYYAGIGDTYPRGAFLLPAVGRHLLGSDVAWLFQPYLAACGAMIAVSVYSLVGPLVRSAPLRALIGFLAAPAALLYGYGLWGGIKEMTAAFLLVLGAALAAPLLRRRPRQAGALVPLAIAAGALTQTLGVGAAGWALLALLAVALAWGVQALREGKPLPTLGSLVWLAGLTAACTVPVLLVASDFLAGDSGLFSSGQSEQVRLGNLAGPLDPFQLVGIWPVGDFRLTPPTLPTAILIAIALACAAGALWAALRRRSFGLPFYVAVALGGCALLYLLGTTPWVIGKTLAISSPALLAAALTGAAMLMASRRWPGTALLSILAVGVLWSTVLAYGEVVLAPRDRLAELEKVGTRLKGHGPTFVNEYNIYANVHLLRHGDPVGPAEYRPVNLALLDGTLLTKPAWADLDSFPLATLQEYPSIVTRRTPAESRPPSNYELVKHGRYYDLWQRPMGSESKVIEHIPLGESTEIPFCGAAEGQETRQMCSATPVAVPSCQTVQEAAQRARQQGAELVASVLPVPIVARGDQTQWPASWIHDEAGASLIPRSPGTATAQISVDASQRYELWLGGSFARGFEVKVDGEPVGSVENQLTNIGGQTQIGAVELEAGVHTIELAYPGSDLSPGSADEWFTSLNSITLLPEAPAASLLRVSPDDAGELCERPLDWIEIASR